VATENVLERQFRQRGTCTEPKELHQASGGGLEMRSGHWRPSSTAKVIGLDPEWKERPGQDLKLRRNVIQLIPIL
jgi:hypothetical protein